MAVKLIPHLFTRALSVHSRRVERVPREFAGSRLTIGVVTTQSLLFLLTSFTFLSSGTFVVCVGEEPITVAQERFFENQIRPILIEHCVECHGPAEQEGELRLDHRAGFRKGGGSGPVINDSQPSSSRLLRSVQYTDNDLQMPPTGKLPAAKIALLKQWVENGAAWPDDQPPSASKPSTQSPEERIKDHRSKHWAYQPIQSIELPQLDKYPTLGSNQQEQVLNGIDRLIGQRLISEGLQANPQADRRTLIHRAYFNLIGLPPSFQEVENFLADTASDAFEKVVDGLLDNPHYGERWARHWLDIARYGDTTGYIAGSAETRYPYAFTFRDYVIDAFNSDKPFDEFITEQLAADQLELEGDSRRNLAAMGFLTVGRRFMNRQVDIIDDQIDVVSRGFLGLSVACARCHDHKYDAIPTADYYSLYGVLASSQSPSELPLLSDSHDSPQYNAFLKAKAAKHQEGDDWLEERRVNTQKELQSRIADYLVYLAKSLPKYAEGKKISMQGARGPLRRAAIARWQRYLTQPNESSEAIWVFLRYLGEIPVAEFPQKTLTLIQAKADSTPKDSDPDRIKWLAELPSALLDQLTSKPPETFPEACQIIGQYLEKTIAVSNEQTQSGTAPSDLSSPQDMTLRQILLSGRTPATLDTQQAIVHLDQGERNRYNQLKNAVNGVAISHPGAPPRAMILEDRANPIQPVIFKRGIPSNRGDQVPRRFLQILEMVDQGAPFQNGSGRMELAKAIASPKNPLTARVIVNRVWQHQFGNGLVRTPSDFGIRGEQPTHPQLLDYLALKFMEEGWSIKKLQKEILLSQTWQQSSIFRQDAFNEDPENRFLWRMPRRRLEFEPLRDRLLISAGELDRSIGGRSVNIHEDATRRALYAYIDREDLPGLLASFDLPSPDASRAKRSETTVPQQALYLMNSPFVLSQAKALAAKSLPLAKGSSTDSSVPFRKKRIQNLYRMALSRDPQQDELKLALDFTDTDVIQVFRQSVRDSNSLSEQQPWHHGFGGWEDNQITYQPFPHFNGQSWQFSDEFPHPDFGYLRLTAEGGHTGASNTLSPIRRWTAPLSGTFNISGTLEHPSDQGDGVTAQLAVSGRGILHQWAAHNTSTETLASEVQLAQGENLYFIVHFNQNTGWDSFNWNPTIDLLDSEAEPKWAGATSWHSKTEFTAASNEQKNAVNRKPLDVWTQLAQTLLLSNEFAFID